MAKSAINQGMLESHVKAMLKEIGLDIKDPSIAETPRRFAEYLMEYRQPLDLEDVLGAEFSVGEGFHSMVTQSKIPFRMICEHHLLPALGHAAIGYVPSEKVVGLSKLTRLVQAVGTERPSLQEIICDRIADVMEKRLKPKGVIVAIKAEHGCMACRGVNAPGVLTTTSSVRGIFRDVPQARSEFFALIGSDLNR